MRGKVAFRRILEFLHGITPAYAGKRPAAWAMAWRTGDHPRVCGEKFSTLFPPPKVAGSPPRMRGKEFILRSRANKTRITPAYAGKSLKKLRKKYNIRDHPRVCGEKVQTLYYPDVQQGSPPRMRGKVLAALMPENRARITPAYAGKSGCCNPDPQGQRDHPRVCGEKRPVPAGLMLLAGSPPRMRGKGNRPAFPPAGGGITPAYAGKRLFQLHSVYLCWDHPRVCGEKSTSRCFLSPELGSPPRMRGKVKRKNLRVKTEGITPAYAGKR